MVHAENRVVGVYESIWRKQRRIFVNFSDFLNSTHAIILHRLKRRCLVKTGTTNGARFVLCCAVSTLTQSQWLCRCLGLKSFDSYGIAALSSIVGASSPPPAVQQLQRSRSPGCFLVGVPFVFALRLRFPSVLPAPQCYGGEDFATQRDLADEIFCKLPPPRASPVA